MSLRYARTVTVDKIIIELVDSISRDDPNTPYQERMIEGGV